MENCGSPLVTAVITTYKREVNIVRRALESIVNQTYDNLEIIVVNDYPEDKELVKQLETMIDGYKEQRFIRYLVMEKNGGACKARNLALQLSRGEYIGYLDDDDEWLRDKIELQVKCAIEHPDAAIIYCNALVVRDDTGKENIRFQEEPLKSNIFTMMLDKNWIGSCSFPLFVVKCLKNVQGFDDEMPALQDWELYLRMLRQYSLAYVEKPIARYHFHEGERISANPLKRIRAFEKMLKEFDVEIHSDSKATANFYLSGTYFYSIGGDLQTAAAYYWKAVKKDPYNVKRNIVDFLRMIWHCYAGKKIA